MVRSAPLASEQQATPPDRAALSSLSSVALARLVPPPPPPAVTRRGRLFDALDAGLQRPLTVLTGPPGAGKTVLLSGWALRRRQASKLAWLSLESGDDQPIRFWSAVLDAIGVTTGSRLGLVPSDDGGGAAFVAAFANAIDGLAQPFVLALDDFEAIRDPRITAELDVLLRRPPQMLRVVIAGRVDPGLSLQRLRLEDQLSELRTADLAFTDEEAAELFELAGLDLTCKQVHALCTRTAGWGAGLRLAALSLDGHPDPDEFVRTFAGDERTVADYLVEQVLHQQPVAMREFMLRTSVVDVVGPELADALTGQGNGARMLERLAAHNGFLVSLETKRAWYRYHPMFAELLRSELHHRMPEAFKLQHRRAARWHAASGDAIPAIRHALIATDMATVSSLVSAQWLAMLVGGEAPRLGDLIARLPRELLVRDPEFASAAAIALLDVGDLGGAHEYTALADAAAGQIATKRRADFAFARTVAALLEARLLARFDEACVAAHKTLAGHPGAQPSASGQARRAFALLNLGIAELWNADLESARAHLDDSLTLARHGGCDYLVLGALSQLGLLEALHGSLRNAANLGREAAQLAGRRGWAILPQVAPAYLALAVAGYHRGELKDAEHYCKRATDAAGRSGERTLRALIEIVTALVIAACGELETAAQAARTARRNAAELPIPRSLMVALVSLEAAPFAADPERAPALEALDRLEADPCSAELAIVRAQLALATGDPSSALRWLEPGSDSAVAVPHPSTVISAHVLNALARHILGDDRTALSLIEEALSQAETDGYRRPFLAVGAPLRELIIRRVRAGTAHRGLAGELIEALDPRRPESASQNRLLLDPLSEREKAVLRYLPTILSKAEIASEMFLSVNTVKTHTTSIYRKLGVPNRAEAVRRARLLRLV